MDSPKGLPLDVVRTISGKLWEDTTVIEEYITKNVQNMSEEHVSIARGWKKVVHGKFVVERHLKNGSILISVMKMEEYIECEEYIPVGEK